MTLQLSVGPVFFAVLHKSIKQGIIEGLKMVLAVTLVDAFYICLSFTAVSGLLKIQYVSQILSVLGVVVLIYFGLMYIVNAHKKSETLAVENKSSSFMFGIKLTLTNPMTIFFWSGTFSSLIGSHKLVGGLNILNYSLGCIFSTIAFLSLTCILSKLLRKSINYKILKIMDYIVGTILIIFGISMYVNVFN
jgi:threonine/homoserine/homoserine lactone efflux protein